MLGTSMSVTWPYRGVGKGSEGAIRDCITGSARVPLRTTTPMQSLPETLHHGPAGVNRGHWQGCWSPHSGLLQSLPRTSLKPPPHCCLVSPVAGKRKPLFPLETWAMWSLRGRCGYISPIPSPLPPPPKRTLGATCAEHPCAQDTVVTAGAQPERPLCKLATNMSWERGRQFPDPLKRKEKT